MAPRAVAVAALGAVLCACTDHGPAPGPAPSATVSAAPSPVGELVTVRGRIARGVEPGCWLLVGDPKRTWLLLGGDPAALVPGLNVTVRGVFRRDVATTCQQGLPMQVRSISVN